MAYFMENMTVEDVINALKVTKTVILPVGVVEQHGYHLPLSTDMYNAQMPLKLAGERLRAVVAPMIPYCFSGGELPGTLNINPNIFGLYLSDICSELARTGFSNIVVFLGHYGTENAQALEASLQMLMRRDPRFENIALSLVRCFAFSETATADMAMTPEHDFHAGLTETSLMLYWAPELVRDKIVMDEETVARNMRSDQDWYAESHRPFDDPMVVPKVSQRKEIKIGVMGFPERATREHGKQIADEIINGLVAYVDRLNNRPL